MVNKVVIVAGIMIVAIALLFIVFKPSTPTGQTVEEIPDEGITIEEIPEENPVKSCTTDYDCKTNKDKTLCDTNTYECVNISSTN